MSRYPLFACALFVAIVASAASQAGPVQSRAVVAETAERLVTEISDWLVSNFDLPSIPESPVIEFVSDAELVKLRYQHPAEHIGADAGGSVVSGAGNLSGVVALYHTSKRTIFLSDNWTGTSPADQSILVHEMVHHVQNVSEMKFECPMARERLAYQAQDRWLTRFGSDLESEFQIDPFTVLVRSACM